MKLYSLIFAFSVLTTVGSTLIASQTGEVKLRFPSDRDQKHNEEIEARIAAGADPSADGFAAASRNDFGLIIVDQDSTVPRPNGITCSTRDGEAPTVRAWFVVSDFIDDRVTSLRRYARAYNRSVVGHRRYPNRDLCRPTS